MPTTTTDLLAPSAFTPPSDPADIHGWLTGHEERIAADTRRALRGALARAVDRWLATVTAAGDAGALGTVTADWGAYVDHTMAKELGGLYLGGAGSAVVKGAPDPAVFAPVVNDRAVSYMSQATNRLKAVGDDAWGRLRGKLTEGMEKSWDLDRVNRELRQQVDMSEWRAETIARTETIGAYNNGNRLGGEVLGDFGPAEHSWLATTDQRTRESHIIANGQCVPFDEPFDVGGVPMMHPSDPTAPPGEVINCRCVEQQLYPGDTRPDGTLVEPPDGRQVPAWTSAPELRQGVMPDMVPRDQIGVYDRLTSFGNSLEPMRNVVAFRHQGIPIAFEPTPDSYRHLLAHQHRSYDEMRAYLIDNNPHVAKTLQAVDELTEVLTERQLQEMPGITLSPARNPADAYWAKRYGRNEFESAATGGTYGITSYSGRALSPGTLRHEVGHVMEQAEAELRTGSKVTSRKAWGDAMKSDAANNTGRQWWTVDVTSDGHRMTADNPKGITGYGQAAPAEDFAESFRLFMLDRRLGSLTQDGSTFADRFPGRNKLIKQLLAKIEKAPARPGRV